MPPMPRRPRSAWRAAAQAPSELERERQITALPPVLKGAALIIPHGLVQSMIPSAKAGGAPGLAEDPASRAETERLAMKSVMAHERARGNLPRDVSAENKGWDIESRDARTGHLRFIEVKGRHADARDVIVTKNEILASLNAPDAFHLALVIDRWREVFDEASLATKSTGSAISPRRRLRRATRRRTCRSGSGRRGDPIPRRHAPAAARVKAPAKEVAELKKLYDAQRQADSRASAGSAPAAAPAPAPKLDARQPGKGLKPWIEVALPHPDVLANRFKEAEFAADLFAVDAGHASEDYATPRRFFRITFLTEGLRRVLTSAVCSGWRQGRRSGHRASDRIRRWQDAHDARRSTTSPVHLNEGGDPAGVPGLAPSVTAWKRSSRGRRVRRFLEGHRRVADVMQNGPQGPHPVGLYRLAARRRSRSEIVAEAEAARTNPGSELMVEVFKLAGPSVILLDELTMYRPPARRRAFRGLLVVHPVADRGGENGARRSDRRLAAGKRCRGGRRTRSCGVAPARTGVRPRSIALAAGIGRRNLRDHPASAVSRPLDTDGESARDETVKAFHDLYKKNPRRVSSRGQGGRYYELLRLSYPIHPELFERLSKDWASLEQFPAHPRRAALHGECHRRVVACAARDPLITPAPRADCARAHPRERALSARSGFAAVVDSEVDGDGSLPCPHGGQSIASHFSSFARRRVRRAPCFSAPRRSSVSRMPA